MTKKNLDNHEISIWSLVWSVSLKWRSIIIAGVVFAVLFCGLGYYKSYKAYKRSEYLKSNPITTENIILSKDLSETAEVYIDYLERYNQQNNYNNNSVLYKLDPNKFYKGELSYYIDNHYTVEYPVIEKNNSTYGITAAYQSVLDRQGTITHIADLLHLDGEKRTYAAEVVDVYNRYGATNTVARDISKGILTISVYTPDEESNKKIIEYLDEVIQNEKNEVTKKYGEHELILNAQNTFLTADTSLLTWKRDIQERMRDFAMRMQELEKTLSGEEKGYINAYRNEIKKEYSNDTVKIQTVPMPKISKKWLVVGFAAGMGLMLILYVLLYIFSEKVKPEDSLEEIFGFKSIGYIELRERKKKGLDYLFESMLFRDIHRFKKEEAIEMVAANLRIYAKKIGADKIYAIGAVSSEEERSVFGEIADILKSSGIGLEYGRTILYDAESLEKAANIGNVIVACAPRVSTYNEVAETLDICLEQKTQVVGLLMVS